MTIAHIRKVRPDELAEVWRVHVASSNDGLVRGGATGDEAGRRPGGERRPSGTDQRPGRLLLRG